MRLDPITALVLAAALTVAPGAPAQSPVPGPAGTRVYLMRGLGGQATSDGVDEIGMRIGRAAPDAVVQVGDWEAWQAFAADAARHPGDRIVLIGFSMGARAAGLAADRLAARRIPVTVIGLDPYCVDAAVSPGPYVRAVSFYANTCGANGRMAGAANVRVDDATPLDHLAFPRSPRVQALVIGEALRGEARGTSAAMRPSTRSNKAAARTDDGPPVSP